MTGILPTVAVVLALLAFVAGGVALLRRRSSARVDEAWRSVETLRAPGRHARTEAGEAPHDAGATGRVRSRSAAPSTTERFDPSMVQGLPKPARRYLLHAIAPGTPLASSVRLTIPGEIRLATDGPPLPMESEEVLVAGRGYVWRARVGRGAKWVVGYDRLLDGDGEMRWWLWGVIPVAHATGDDVSRSAVGRLLGESIFLPSMLLSRDARSDGRGGRTADGIDHRGVRWEAVDDATGRVHVAAFGEETTLTLDIDPDGRLRRVTFPRWNGDPRNGPVGYLPFGSDRFAEERSVAGYTIPTRVRAGWRLGDEDEYPFFFARITEIEYR